LTRVEGPARFAKRLSAAAARSSAALQGSAGYTSHGLDCLRFRLCPIVISFIQRYKRESLHFASGVLLEPRMSLVVRLRGFRPGFRSAHPTVDKHLDQIIDVALSVISISLGDF
jgi:hypothetical protein